MSQEKEKAPPMVKVKRSRKRLYEQPAEPAPVTEEAPAEPAGTPAAAPLSSRQQQADQIIKRYVIWAAGSALIPVPTVDMAGMMVLEMLLLKKLCTLYDIPFSTQLGKTLIASLFGGALPVGFLAASLVKLAPFIGFGGVVLPLASACGGVTYAIGKVFTFHFETGGVLLDFDAAKMEKYFHDKFQEGKQVAADIAGKRNQP